MRANIIRGNFFNLFSSYLSTTLLLWLAEVKAFGGGCDFFAAFASRLAYFSTFSMAIWSARFRYSFASQRALRRSSSSCRCPSGVRLKAIKRSNCKFMD